MTLAELAAHPLPFGKHEGKRLDKVPINYVVWLAGKRVNDSKDHPITRNVLADLADTVWMNRNAGCACDDKKCNDPDYHTSSCYAYCLGATREETKRKCKSRILNDEVTFRAASSLRPWLWVDGNYPGEVAYARRYLEMCNRCFVCGRKLVAVGHDRANGKDHPDWPARKLHKKCWKELED